MSAESAIHTVRWANGLREAGLKVHVISQHPVEDPFDPAVEVHVLQFRGALGSFSIVPAVRKLLKEIQPDIVNAHYASGYGTTARLVGWRPWILSVWGSDVYDFPSRSPLHAWLIRRNVLSADRVFSTSKCMAEQTQSVAKGVGDIAITPFGVEMACYQNILPLGTDRNRDVIVGTVKVMSQKYGIDTLIEAFALLRNRLRESDDDLGHRIALRLVGDGPQLSSLKALVSRLGIEDAVSFLGRVPHAQVPNELAKMDVYVALSRLDSESFGVAILEAGAAGRPVIVSDAGGLPEVTVDGVTGMVVPRENP